MRRQRQRLQVSTFPFLAVLLCAMGALILFLLVMDRRAHIVAKQKALNTLASLEQEEERKFTAEVEARKKELHDRLALQHQQTVLERKTLDHRAQLTQQKIKENEAALQELRQRLAGYATATKQAQASALQQRTALTQTKNQEGAAQTKLQQLTAELEQMENALRQLKAANEKPTEVVALAPYRGTQGDNRRPIYVECRSDGFTLHPDPLMLKDGTPLELRQGIEKRLGASNSTYVMFLVRPDGIGLYYRALAALEGMKVDFGYELVDRDWVLALSMPEEGGVTESSKQLAPLVLGNAPPPRPAVAQIPTQGGDGPAGLGFVSSGPDLPSSKDAKGPAVASPPRLSQRPSSTASSEGPELPSSNGTGSAMGTSQGVRQQPTQSTGGSAASGATNTAAPGANGAPAELSFRPVKPAPPPVGRLLGNRDLTLVLECTRDGVVFSSANELYPLNSLRRDPKGNHPLAAEIKQLIARRQAGVQPGEAPYQPSIRFRIHPDGLRAYYLVYPLLENLRIPMARENIE